MNSWLRAMAAPATAVLSLTAVGALALPANASAGFNHRRVPTAPQPTKSAGKLRPAEAADGDSPPPYFDICSLFEGGDGGEFAAARAHALTGHIEIVGADYGCGKIDVKVSDPGVSEIPSVTFELCEVPETPIDDAARPNGARDAGGGCPDGDTPVESTTSDGEGNASFSDPNDVFFCASQYIVNPLNQPLPGYEPLQASGPFSIPDANCNTSDPDTSGSDALPPYVVDFTLTRPAAPQPAPTALDDSATTPEGKAVTIDALANDSPATSGSTISITNVGSPNDGSATTTGSAPQTAHAKRLSATTSKQAAASQQEVRYTPKAGFVGTDTFPYTITDSDGQTATANVTVKVTPVQAAATPTPTPTPTVKDTHKARPVTKATKRTKTTTPSAATLPFTGAPVTTELTWGAALVLIGGWLTVAGARRRRTRH